MYLFLSECYLNAFLMKLLSVLTNAVTALTFTILVGCSGSSTDPGNTSVTPSTKSFRLTEKTNSDGTLKYFYGNNGLTKIEAYTGSTLDGYGTFSYSADKLITYQAAEAKTNKVNYKLDFKYDSKGRMNQYVETEAGNTKTFNIEFDAQDRPVKSSTNGSGIPTVSTYEYDINDNIIKFTEISGTVITAVTYDNKINYRKIRNLPFPLAEIFNYGSNNAVNGTYYDRTHTPQNTSFKIDLTFDSDGKVVKAVSYDSGKLSGAETYKYEQY